MMLEAISFDPGEPLMPSFVLPDTSGLAPLTLPEAFVKGREPSPPFPSSDVLRRFETAMNGADTRTFEQTRHIACAISNIQQPVFNVASPAAPSVPAAPSPVVPDAPVPVAQPRPVAQPAAVAAEAPAPVVVVASPAAPSVPAAPSPVVPDAPVPVAQPRPVAQPAAVAAEAPAPVVVAFPAAPSVQASPSPITPDAPVPAAQPIPVAQPAVVAAESSVPVAADSSAAPLVQSPRPSVASDAPALRPSIEKGPKRPEEMDAPQIIITPVVTEAVATQAMPAVADVSAPSVRTELLVETVNQIVEAVSEQILVTPSLTHGEGEVRILLKPTVLDGSAITLSAKEGTLTVAVAPATQEAEQTALAALPRLEAALAVHAPTFRHVAVTLIARKGKTDETA